MAAAKPRIDLKARLGRKSAAPSAAPPAAPAASVPPAAAVPSVAPVASPSAAPAARPSGPAPIMPSPIATPSAAPPAGAGPMAPAGPSAAPAAPVGGGPKLNLPGVGRPAAMPPGGQSIPPPPGFGKKPEPKPEPKPVAAAPAPLAIKMDVGEEVHQARAAARKKTLVLALATAIVGVVIGTGIGSMMKGKEGADAAVQGAELLIKEIDAANTKVSELNDVLKAAAQKVKSDEFPSEEIEKLGGLEIPFDGTNLTNKGIGRFNPMAVTMLLQYANSIESVKEQRDKIRRLFGAVKPAFETKAKEKTDPQVHWGAMITTGPKGPWVTMKRLKPFAVNKPKDKKYRWDQELEGADGKKVSRYTKGDPGKADGPEVIPVDPKSEGGVCPNNMRARLMSALLDLGKAIQGDSTPGREVPGILDMGDKLSDQLRKIGGPG